MRVTLNNPRLLEWARRTAGYSVEDIAGHMGKSSATVRAWEAGTEAPTYVQLRKLAKKLKRPVAALYLPEEPPQPGHPEDLRVLPGRDRGVFGPQVLVAFRRLRNSLATLREIADELGDPLELSLPKWDGLGGSMTDRAAVLRDVLGVSLDDQVAWKGPREALDGWRSALFDVGVLVQVFQMPVEDARGFSLMDFRLGGVGLSSRDAVRAQIFSLFHEVAHLCLRRPAVSSDPVRTVDDRVLPAAQVERRCDEFAAAFLLPSSARVVQNALDDLGTELTEEKLAHYVRRFKVSKYVLARRLVDVGRLQWDAYWDLYRAWHERDEADSRRRARGGNYVSTTVSQAGRRYVGLVLDAVGVGILTTHGASRILSLKPEHIEQGQLVIS